MIVLKILMYLGLGIGGLIAAYALYMLIIAIVPGFNVPKQPLARSRQSEQASPQSGKKRSGALKDVGFEVKGVGLASDVDAPVRSDLDIESPLAARAAEVGGEQRAAVLGCELHEDRIRWTVFGALVRELRGEIRGQRTPDQIDVAGCVHRHAAGAVQPAATDDPAPQQ